MAISYGDTPSSLEPYRGIAKSLRLLETVRDLTAKNFNLPRPLTIEAKPCGEPNAYWDPQERRVTLCYELLHANLALSP